jgi:thioredoxin reductase (NADPH)
VKTVRTGLGKTFESRTVILATGSAYRRLGLEDEDRLSGHGVSWCATCDGFFFRDRVIGVVGGGDSALEEATFLSRFASKVYLIHRRDELRASRIMQQRALADEKIVPVWNSQVVALNGDTALESVELEDTVTGERRTLELEGLFIAIGNDPRTDLFADQIDLTAQGTVALDGRSSRTSAPGVFACGDVTDPSYRQAITAAGSGCVAALDAERHLAALADTAEAEPSAAANA